MNPAVSNADHFLLYNFNLGLFWYVVAALIINFLGLNRIKLN